MLGTSVATKLDEILGNQGVHCFIRLRASMSDVWMVRCEAVLYLTIPYVLRDIIM